MRSVLALALSISLVGALLPASAMHTAVAEPTNDQDSANPTSPLENTGSLAPSQNESQLPLEDQVRLFEARVASLDTNLEITSEEINLAKEKLTEIRERIAEREKDLATVRKDYEDGRDRLAEQAKAEYLEGPASYLELVLNSKDIASLLDTYEFIQRISEEQQATQKKTEAQKKALEDELVQLKRDELDAQSLEFELEAKQIEMQHRRAEYEKLFDDANKAVIREYNRNNRQQSNRDAQNLRAFLKGGYTVEAGSVVETALSYRGIPYVWGGESKQGMDCSGLVLYVFKQHGVKLPHNSAAQYKLGTPIPVSQLQPGDAVFFGSPVHHVGIYIGGEYFIHAPTFGDVVKVSKLSAMGDYVGARRYDWSTRTGDPL